ncbi:MAG: porin [Tannerellaceae bacterium]
MNKSILMGSLVAALLCGNAQAQEKKLEVRPTGRILVDGGWLDSNNKDLTGGLAIPDIRAGVKASYGAYKAKVDVGFAYCKLSLKDVFVERSFGQHNLVRLGYFVHQFGLQSCTSSSMKISMEEPESNEAFFNSRLIGAMYMHNKGKFFGTLSFHVENEAIKKNTAETGKQGYGMMSRLVYRPFIEDGKILHVGISGAFETPRYNSNPEYNHKTFVLKSNFPSRISKVVAQEATILDAKRLYKFTPEICMAYNKIGLESQYYYVNVQRKNNPNFRANGAYVLLRGVLLGGKYTYSTWDSGIATPQPGTLECVLGYNYANLSASHAGILGGRQNDASLTLNYYINKYMIWRLHYSYTRVDDRSGFDNVTLNAIQTRFQVIF